tara:strand:- start:905 stop:1345 length:441 start_codon:yes stop_codon:yes gene_type:complete
MAEYLIKNLPIELCHHINVLNLHHHNYKLVMKDLLNTYWEVWIDRFKFKSNSNIYYYFLSNFHRYNLIYNEYQYFNILLREFKYNHIIYKNKLYHPIYEEIYKKNIDNYYRNTYGNTYGNRKPDTNTDTNDIVPCYSDTFITDLNE